MAKAETFEDMLDALMEEGGRRNNIIVTGAGSLPMEPYDTSAAVITDIRRGLAVANTGKDTDYDLLKKYHSDKLYRLLEATVKGEQVARFRPKTKTETVIKTATGTIIRPAGDHA